MGTTNADGLYLKFGTEKAKSLVDAGDYKTFAKGESIIEVELNLAELTEVEQVLSDVTAFPKNAQITWVEVVTEIAATTGTAIDVGLTRASARGTQIDYDGFLAAFPIAQMNAVGETSRFFETHTEPTSMTGTGALVGQLSSADYVGLITASRTDSTAFGAGRIKIRIGYVESFLANNGN